MTYAVEKTEEAGGNVTEISQKTTEEIIDDLNLIPCAFDRDSLFTIVVAEPHLSASLLSAKPLTKDHVYQS